MTDFKSLIASAPEVTNGLKSAFAFDVATEVAKSIDGRVAKRAAAKAAFAERAAPAVPQRFATAKVSEISAPAATPAAQAGGKGKHRQI